MTELAGLIADAREAGASERRALAEAHRAARSAGAVLLETCHRVELYGTADAVRAAARSPGTRWLEGADVPRHLVTVAVGRASAVLGEDQVLHQLRDAVADARRRGPLPPELDRILDLALRAGRRARSWLPARRPSLADVALVVASSRTAPRSGPVLIVGAGRMGSLAGRAALRRGHDVAIASRTPERSARAAADLGVRAWSFVPSPDELTGVAGVLVALSGAWPLSAAAASALARSGAWVADLSSPPATPAGLRRALGDRFVSIDDLAAQAPSVAPDIRTRLDRLIEATVAEHERWLADAPLRTAAHALAGRAEHARDAELEALYARVSTLNREQREAVAHMADRLAARLLRDPLERLREDRDGRLGRAARELFGL